MKKALLFPLLLLLIISCQPSQSTSNTAYPEAYLVSNVQLIDVQKGETSKPQDVLIQKDKIIAIHAGGSMSTRRNTVINGHNQYLMLGLADMHVHLPSDSVARQRFLLQHLLAGVTFVRSMRGAANHVALRESIQNGPVVGPGMYLASQPIRRNMEMTPVEVEALVQQFKATGYDAIKVLSVADSATFQALVAASKKYDLPLCGHVSSNIGLLPTLASNRYTSIEHLGGYFRSFSFGEANLITDIKRTAQAGVYNCATLDYYKTSTKDLATLEQQAGMEYISTAQKEAWKTAFLERHNKKTASEKQEAVSRDNTYNRVRLRMIKALHEHQAPLLISPDATGIFAVPGFSLLRELKLHEEAGIPRLEVLQIATHHAAKFVGEEQYGGLGVGQKANCILLGANPLEDLDNLATVQGVFCNGKWRTKQQLEEQLEGLK